MGGRFVGYEFLRNQLNTCARPLDRPAAVFPVTKVIRTSTYLQVPPTVAPQTDAPIEHLMFAFKHEGMDLHSAILALKHISAEDVGSVFRDSPSSANARRAAYLWEIANGRDLVLDDPLPSAVGGYVDLLDPSEFITTAKPVRNARWRVDFNGLGDPSYSPTVRRTPEINALLAQNTLEAASAYVDGLPPSILDRAVRWAYLSETEGSYKIEREMPTATKAQAFAALLARAHEQEPITEEYLVALQQLSMTNPLEKAFEFRGSQNWLRNGHVGALGVTYVPPRPQDLPQIMASIMHMANTANESKVNPLVMGTLVSFAFVFAHPFTDGNGRLSRFLFHRVVCSSGQLKHGLVLPVSVAMERHEGRYLEALKDFSGPAREAWEVTWIDGDQFDFKFQGDPEMYRYWDATAAVEFGLAMAEEALRKDLQEESDFLVRYDRLYAAVNDAVDMNGNDLAILVRGALQNDGVISNGRYKQFLAKGHPRSILTWAQQAIARVYEEPSEQARQERLEALHGLEAMAGTSYTLWQVATQAIELQGSAEAVDWDAVHAEVLRRSVVENGQPAGIALAVLAESSPGVTTAASQAALRLMLADVAQEPGRSLGLDLGPAR